MAKCLLFSDQQFFLRFRNRLIFEIFFGIQQLIFVAFSCSFLWHSAVHFCGIHDSGVSKDDTHKSRRVHNRIFVAFRCSFQLPKEAEKDALASISLPVGAW
jgi:hypothetical protein